MPEPPLTWAEISVRTTAHRESVYDWCWVCGLPLGPDKMHVMIDNGRLLRHTYCCRKHRYVVVEIGDPVVAREVQVRTDHEIESLAHAFRAGELAPGWE